MDSIEIFVGSRRLVLTTATRARDLQRRDAALIALAPVAARSLLAATLSRRRLPLLDRLRALTRLSGSTHREVIDRVMGDVGPHARWVILERPRAHLTPAMDPSARPEVRVQEDSMDWIEVIVEDPDGQPIGGVDYHLILGDGSSRRGTTRADGSIRYRDIPSGNCVLSLPNLDEQLWSLQ